MRVFSYKNCGTCRKAIKWLNERQIPYETVAIRENPPTFADLKKALTDQGGNLRALFNTSGRDYRSMGLSQTLPEMSEKEALHLLSENGNLVKRPFVVGEGFTLVGFREEEWEATLQP